MYYKDSLGHIRCILLKNSYSSRSYTAALKIKQRSCKDKDKVNQFSSNNFKMRCVMNSIIR